jgi:glutamate synthase (NADPH/NADH) small chain
VPDPWGFVRTPRAPQTRRPVDIRIMDWDEVYARPSSEDVRAQAGRCMDCGIPFCHAGCPLGNLIPEWNDLVWRDDWQEAAERLHATNNFPEFTGRLCPAPCEPACVLSISAPLSGGPVTIKTIEQAIADRARDEGWIQPLVPERLSGHTIAVIGSGPAGLAAAQQLTRAGHTVCVYERDDALGGLMRYGIPDFKMDKHLIDGRVAQMRAEGTIFRTGVEVGVDLPADKLRRRYDAIVLAGGALRGRDVPIPGRELAGIHQAMTYLAAANRARNTGGLPEIDAAGKRVVIIGGGDTAADCLGTAHRQGAASVVQLDIHPQPPEAAHASTPWPTWPLLYRESPAHEEGGARRFAVTTTRFVPSEHPAAGGWSEPEGAHGGTSAEGPTGAVAGLELAELLEADEFGRSRREGRRGEPFVVDADLVLLAVGFAGPDHEDLLDSLGVRRDQAGRIVRDAEYHTESPGIFAAGDVGRGASLVVWAIAEGRAVAAAVDRHLGGAGLLPEPVHADTQPMR